MANTFINTSWVSREALEIIQPNMVLGGSINSDYSNEFGKESMKVGASIQVPLPQQYVGRTGQSVNIEGLADRTTPVTITTQYGVDFQVSSQELKLNVMDATKRYIKPAMVNIAAKIDRDIATQMALLSVNQTGTAGTALTDDSTVRNAQVALDESEAPYDEDRWLVVNSRQEQAILNATKAQFNDQAELGKQYKMNRMGRAMGFNWAMSQNIQRLTTGNYGGTPVINGASQVGSTLAISGLTAGATINQGDKFNIAGVYGVEVIGKNANAGLQTFTVTSGATANGSGQVTVNIFPSIVAVGQYQNVTNAPANSAAVTFLNPANTTGARALAYHKDSFTIAFAKLDEPKAVESCTTVTDEKSGVSIRSMVFYTGTSDVWIYRFDVLYGISPLYPQWSSILASN